VKADAGMLTMPFQQLATGTGWARAMALRDWDARK
jgi:hypothetical protein